MAASQSHTISEMFVVVASPLAGAATKRSFHLSWTSSGMPVIVLFPFGVLLGGAA